MPGVGGQVRDIHPEADHRGLVDHRIDPAGAGGAAQARTHGVGVAQVGDPQVPTGGVLRPRRMHCRGQRVQHDDVVAAGGQGADDVRTDEAGPARDEYAHVRLPVFAAGGYWRRLASSRRISM